MTRITGTRNADTLSGTELADILGARAGDDLLSGGLGNDTLYGGAGADTLDGGDGNDRLKSGGGDDFILHSAGRDILVTGDGADTLAVAGQKGVTIWKDFTTGEDKIALDIPREVFDTLVRIETGFGTATKTVVTFGESKIILRGIDPTSISSDDFIFNAPTFNEINAWGGKVVGTDVFDDKIVGTSGFDDLFGKDGDDLLIGNGGNDWLTGGFGNDTLLGGDGDDRIFGAIGDDLVIGGDGDDRIQPGPATDGGQDTVYGGAGADTIDLYTYSINPFAPDAPIRTSNVLWKDFDDGIDMIDISGLTAENFADRVTISQTGGGGTQISHEGIEITLEGITPRQITIDDFDL
jgi:Ca2+-binding RTX toxin-like protein